MRVEFLAYGLRVEVLALGRLTRDGLELTVRLNGGRPLAAFYGPLGQKGKAIWFGEPPLIGGWPCRALRVPPGAARVALEEAYEAAFKECFEDAERYRTEEPPRYVLVEGPDFIGVFPEFDWQPRHELPPRVRNRYAELLKTRLRQDRAFRAAVLGRARPAGEGRWVVEASDVPDLEPESATVCRSNA